MSGMSYETPSIEIRQFSTQDRPAIEQVLQAIWTNDVGAISYYMPREALVKSDEFHYSLVAEHMNEENSSLIGIASASCYSSHPTHIDLNINVHPNFQAQGVGKLLFEKISKKLQSQPKLPFMSATYEDQGRAIAFLEDRGYHEWGRTYLPRLDVTKVDLDTLKQRLEHVEAIGYQILTMNDLASDKKRDEKLGDLIFEIYANIHPKNPPSQKMYEQRQEIFVDGLTTETSFIAVKDHVYAAFGGLVASEHTQSLDFETFGVHPAFREHGFDLSLAIKYHEIIYAQAHRVKYLVVEVDKTDEWGMHVMSALPFEHRPAWVIFEKIL